MQEHAVHAALAGSGKSTTQRFISTLNQYTYIMTHAEELRYQVLRDIIEYAPLPDNELQEYRQLVAKRKIRGY